MTAAELDPFATFVELGFDSLFMTQATSAISGEFGIRLSFRQLFEEAPSIDALAAWLDHTLDPDVVVGSPSVEPTMAPSVAPTTTPADADSEANTEARGGTGPWRPPETGRDELDDQRRAHITDLAERLSSKAPGSKRLTQQNRGHLADPRSAAGFRRTWKELVFPVVVDSSSGSRVRDIDGNEYLDVAMGFGVNLFGHSPPFVIDAVQQQITRGIEIGPQTPLAGETAALISEMTGHERVAFCNTGSEAVLAALRLARTATGRSGVLTFADDYHGLFDEVLARGVNRGGRRMSIPIAPGIPSHASQEMVIFDYGDPEALHYIADHRDELAAVLVEPVQSRHPDLQPVDYLRQLRAATTDHAVPLVFDEMITGFRSHPGGVQALFGVKADLATYGKVIGGGFPIGVVAGDARFMDGLDGGAWRYGDDSYPEADVTWFAGTFVRHPVALAASRAVLQHMRNAGADLQRELNDRTAAFVNGINEFLTEVGAPMSVETFSSMFLTRFHRDQQYASLFYFHLRDQGIHITEGRSAFLSTAHSDTDLEFLTTAYRNAVQAMIDGGFLTTADQVDTAASATAASVAGIGRTVDGEQLLPTTDGQQEILLAASQSDEANCAYNLSNTLHIQGEVDAGRLQAAVDGLVARYEALRVSFTDDLQHQVVPPVLTVPIEVIDLTPSRAVEAAERLEAERVAAVTTPFDLFDGPMVRVRLIRMPGGESHLFLTVHHAVCDGWSSGTLLRRLTEFYTAAGEGRRPELPPVLPLAEFAGRFQTYRNGADYTEDRAIWIERTGTDFPVTDLPADRPRPAAKTFAANRTEVRIDQGTYNDLRDLAKAQGVTLFSVLLGSFECYLARVNSQPEVGLAVSIAGQIRVGNQDLVAHAVNAMPLRRPVDLAGSIGDHFRSTVGAFFDAYEHQDFSYGAIVREVGVRRDPSRTPLVSIIFNMDSPSTPLDLGGVTAIPGSNPRRFEIFDAFLNVVPFDDHLTVECTYNCDLFDEATVQRRLSEWLCLLEAMTTAGPEATIGSLMLLPDDQRATIDGWNDTAADLGPDADLASLFADAVRANGGRTALVVGDRHVSYAELAAAALDVADRLRSEGVGAGSMVGVLCERGVEMMVGLYGIELAGAAYVPLDPEYPASRLDYMITETGGGVVLTQAHLASMVGEAARTVIELDGFAGEGRAADGGDVVERLDDRPASSGDGLAYVIYTSGSTGRPKGVANNQSGVVNRLRWMQQRYPIGPDNVLLQKTPFSFDVSVWELFWPLQTGARLVIAEPGGHRDPAYLVDVINRHGVDTIHFVPSMLRHFLDHPDVVSCVSLKRVICSGEALTSDLQERFFAVLPNTELHNLYGPTEAAVDVTVWQCVPDDEQAVVPIGAPIANTTMHVLDPQMRRQPIGVPGEIYIGGVQVAAGYVNRDDLTAERFVPDPFSPGGRLYRTGDLGRWAPTGVIEYLGRVDHQVKIRGNRIELGEIEAALEEHPAIKTAAVLVNGSAGDERLEAFVVGGIESPVQLRAWLGERLPQYMVPSLFTELATMPMTTSGKIDRNALVSNPMSGARAAEVVAPRTPIEEDLTRIWAEVLGIEGFGVTTDFFDLGGHSLNAVQVNGRIRDEFGVRIPLVELQRTSTIEAQALLLTQLLAEDMLDDEILDLLAGEGSGPGS